MSTVCAIRGARLLALVTLAFAAVLSAASYARADPPEGIAIKCQPSPTVAPDGNSGTMINLKCDADAKVELLVETDQGEKAALKCDTPATVSQPALPDKRATITLQCHPDVNVRLPRKDSHGQDVALKCDTPATVSQSAPPQNSVTITLQCHPNVKVVTVELIAKTDQGERVTLNCGTDTTVGQPTLPDNIATITLKQCEVQVHVRVELATQTQLTLNCDPGTPEATYILDQPTKTVTYRNPKVRPEETVAKKCPQKRCDLGEFNFIYCETWKAQFINNVVDWIRCDMDAGTPGSNDEQKDEVTIDLQTGVMRQKFTGNAVKGMADRTWNCKVVKPKLITAKAEAEKIITEKTTSEKVTTDKSGAVLPRKTRPRKQPRPKKVRPPTNDPFAFCCERLISTARRAS